MQLHKFNFTTKPLVMGFKSLELEHLTQYTQTIIKEIACLMLVIWTKLRCHLRYTYLLNQRKTIQGYLNEKKCKG